MNCGVYLITNKSNNKVYVGKSIIVKYRWKKHLWKLKQCKHHNLHLQSAFNKNGIDSFEFSMNSGSVTDVTCLFRCHNDPTQDPATYAYQGLGIASDGTIS
jgi:hypothetical protein